MFFRLIEASISFFSVSVNWPGLSTKRFQLLCVLISETWTETVWMHEIRPHVMLWLMCCYDISSFCSQTTRYFFANPQNINSACCYGWYDRNPAECVWEKPYHTHRACVTVENTQSQWVSPHNVQIRRCDIGLFIAETKMVINQLFDDC